VDGLARLRRASLAARNRRHLDQPLYYGGKWWARRLAVVTAWMVKEALDGTPGTILDPFVGSGTTLGEALRLGHRAIGIEINPFGAALTSQAFNRRRPDLGQQYDRIVEEVLEEIKALYGSTSIAGYFWCFEQNCPSCGSATLLLNRCIMVQHAYRRKQPAGWVICPQSRHIFWVRDINVRRARCPCGYRVPLEPGPYTSFRCSTCKGAVEPWGPDALRPKPPRPALVAVERRKRSIRQFTRPSPRDLRLARNPLRSQSRLPAAPIAQGSSTDQLLRWGYRDWRDVMHPRQLILAEAIAKRISGLSDADLRNQLAIAFSPLLEYHSRLCSFKGLGTGAVRQAFAAPVLHPVTISYEVNPTFDSQSGHTSGSPRGWYSLRTEPCARAFDALEEVKGRPIVLGSPVQVVEGRADVAVACADSAKLSLPSGSVDAVITDPPYFNRIHYDDLAGAFTAWLTWCGAGGPSGGKGIQSEVPEEFSRGLVDALRPAVAALKSTGKLTFTFHHQQLEAWLALARALLPLPLIGVSITVVASEMPNTKMRLRAGEPITSDVVMSLQKGHRIGPPASARTACMQASRELRRLPRILRGDLLSVAFGAGVIAVLASSEPVPNLAEFLSDVRALVELSVGRKVSLVLA